MSYNTKDEDKLVSINTIIDKNTLINEFNIKYEVEGRVITNELYPNPPIHITYFDII